MPDTEPKTRRVTIQWSSVEYFSCVRDIDEAELLEWLGSPEPTAVREGDVKRFIEAGDPHDDYDLRAMSSEWHDRDAPVVDGVAFE
jgi:hypothetical protein